MKALVLAPHADDEIIGCGGYLAKMISGGIQVEVAYLTTPNDIRNDEIQKVKEFMGFSDLHLLNQGNGRYLRHNEELVGSMLSIIRRSAPRTMLFPHSNEQDKDHKFFYDLAIECSYLCASDFMLAPGETPVTIDNLLGYEVWTPIESPSLHIDISKFMSAKEQAMQLYSSQMVYKDFVAMFKGLNQYRGIVSGLGDFAEAFQIYKARDPVLERGDTN